jgi:cob(I)alamin adenosyltransferase
VARTVCRRAEREVVALSRHEDVRGEAIRYLNRLSDLLFVLARVLARASGEGEVLWKHDRRKPASG